MRENGPQCDPLPNVICDFPIYITRLEGLEDIDWLLDDIAKDGYRLPAGGKRRLIRRERFASWISKNARPHDPGGGGGGGGDTYVPRPSEGYEDGHYEIAHGHC